MTITAAQVHGWPGFRMSVGDVSLGIVPDLGGRIMSLEFRGEELLYVPPDGGGVFPRIPDGEIKDMAAVKRAFGFRIFGGDKTWVAPEREWVAAVPPLDLDAARYGCDMQDGCCVMTSPVCRETGLQVIRRIGFLDSGDVFLIETLKNVAAHAVSKGVWNVTQVRRPFTVYVPAAAKDVRSYHHEDPTLPDPGYVPSEKNGWTAIACAGDACSKFGAILREGRVALFKETRHGLVVFARVFDIAKNMPYAHGSMVEVFNSSQYPYGEIEVHGPLAAMPPGGEVSLTQLWRIYLHQQE